ncbi:MAG: hypothetical protein AAB449_03470 [Patescibacteria group bacterium]
MQFLKDNKWMIGGVVGAALLAYVYFAYFSGGTEPVLTSTADSQSTAVTQELLATLGNLRVIKLDASIFEDPVFVSLSDFGVVIPPQPVGRRNPFEPFNGSGQGGEITVPGLQN